MDFSIGSYFYSIGLEMWWIYANFVLYYYILLYDKNRHIEIKRSGLKGHHLLAQGNALEQINLSCRTRRLYLHLRPHGACFSMPIRFIRAIRVRIK